jgi:hypothetical protein
MCDNGGPLLHTRLTVKNTASSPKQILVQDPFATAVYDPPGPIAGGKGTLVHLTSKRGIPAHSVTLASNGQTKSMPVPGDPCPVVPPTTKPTTATTKPTTNTTKPTTQTTGGVVPPDPGHPGTPGGPVVQPGVVVVGAAVGSNGAAAVSAASTGTLPFTGSDIRGFALLGNLMVLLGFAMLIISHRSPRTAAFFKRMRPSTTS